MKNTPKTARTDMSNFLRPDLLPRRPWTANFGSSSGYDCMTPGWDIRDASGEIMMVVDYKDFGNARGDETPNPMADAVAAFIIEAANKGE